MERHPFLTVVGAEVVTFALVVVAWNVVQRYRDNGASLRSVLRF